MVQAERVESRKKARSPSYPGIGLEEALEKARLVYKHEGRNAAPVDAILQHWKYNPSSGPGLVALAALKKFGLLVDQGSGAGRRAAISDEARRIIVDEREDSSERTRLIQEAALKPTIHAELWQEYAGELPSDATLKHKLLIDHGFTERAVREFIGQFRETLAFAGLTHSGTMSGQDGDKPPQGGANAMPPNQNTATLDRPKNSDGVREINIPLSWNESMTLRVSAPLTEAKWKRIEAVLGVMKYSLIDPEPEKQGELFEGDSDS